MKSSSSDDDDQLEIIDNDDDVDIDTDEDVDRTEINPQCFYCKFFLGNFGGSQFISCINYQRYRHEECADTSMKKPHFRIPPMALYSMSSCPETPTEISGLLLYLRPVAMHIVKSKSKQYADNGAVKLKIVPVG
ncbi:hypothetical protein FQA39_LY09333 [Lamprigera yunnana]|nr:hypothetical protein FQA39_LY09333 [Lamprigera yunnana]